LALAAGLGCSANRGAPKPAGSEAGTPQRGGTLRRRSVTDAFLGGFDPHLQAGSQTGEMGFFYQGLVRLNPATIAIEPELAQKWEQPSQTEYLFHLQPGVKWHDKPPVSGRPLVAADVVSSLERLRSSDPRFINRSLLDSVDQIQAVDQATVRMTAKVADASIVNNLAAFSANILAPEVVQKAGKFPNAEDAVGTGAFVLQSRDDTGAILVRNPDYWKPGLPYLDGIRNAVFKDDESAWAAFLVGQLDTNYVPGTEAQKLFAEQASKYHLAWFSDVGWVGLQANLKKKPFDDPRVTQGMRLLVDHEEALTAWANVYLGRGRLSSALPAALDAWDFTEDEYRSKFLEFKRPKDEAIKESLSLLAAAGFSKDNPLKFALNGLTGPLAFTTAQSELMQLRAWCADNRHVVVGQYIDYESDGTERRPERARLFTDADAARKQFDMVMVWALDSFNAKGVGQTAVDIQHLLQHGVTFHSFTEDHLCTDDAQAHHVLLPVIFSFANLEKQKLSRRIKAGLQRARAKGTRLGRAPFSRAQLQKLRVALDTGANWHRVSRTTGIPYSTVKKWARELGREPPGRGAF